VSTGSEKMVPATQLDIFLTASHPTVNDVCFLIQRSSKPLSEQHQQESKGKMSVNALVLVAISPLE
jgi:hypothetical protein